MNKEELHAIVEEVWRRKVSMASMSTEQLNSLVAFKEEMHREIDALEDEDKASATPEVRFHDIRAEADPIIEPRGRKDENE